MDPLEDLLQLQKEGEAMFEAGRELLEAILALETGPEALAAVCSLDEDSLRNLTILLMVAIHPGFGASLKIEGIRVDPSLTHNGSATGPAHKSSERS